jgi:hypothetical protein
VIDKSPHTRTRLLHETMFSIYFALLIVWANTQTGRNPWVVRLRLLFAPGRPLHTFMDARLRLAMGVLWGLFAVIVFLCLRMFSRFSFTDFFLRTFAGMIAIAGFPLAYMLCFHLYLGWTVVEPAVALVCASLYLYRGWPISLPWSILLLVIHFGLWTLAACNPRIPVPGWFLLWPGYDWMPLTRHYPNLIYPLLGFFSTLCWVAYVRHSGVTEQRGKQV